MDEYCARFKKGDETILAKNGACFNCSESLDDCVLIVRVYYDPPDDGYKGGVGIVAYPYYYRLDYSDPCAWWRILYSTFDRLVSTDEVSINSYLRLLFKSDNLLVKTDETSSNEYVILLPKGEEKSV